ncbi:MAG: hypothetical protein U9Q62_00945 [Campylobacterota bacterium]|nr:hypothetical protein [Campylobacterota bacterium]
MNTLNSYQSLEAYRSHDLSIQMRTSSGDTIDMAFSNTQELSMKQSQQNGTKSGTFSFASMQSYQFHMESNGIDEQDKKEIEAFMEIAQPFIDNFMKELESGEQHTPLNQIVKSVSDIFAPVGDKPINTQNYAKNGIVNLMDNALKQVEQHKTLLDESQKFLDKVLQRMDKFEEMLYA